jgi:hypothetical protein
MDIMGHVIIEVWECNPVLCANWLTDNDLVDIIELIPVFIPVKVLIKIISHHQTAHLPCS